MNLRSIDLNLLVIFDALMAEQSIAGAGRKVGLTPSAMSHALRRLRQTFNDELLERTGRGMVPTKRALELWGPVGAATVPRWLASTGWPFLSDVCRI